MRIGELAALVGVSTRTVRHYHHIGLLPEPARQANGYREYRLADAVALARVRQLARLGLSLDELRDALADDDGRDLREVLQELDADLAREQEAIAARRARLAALLARVEEGSGTLMSADMAGLLRELSLDGSRFAELDRQMLTLASAMGGPEGENAVVELMRPLTEPGMLARGLDLYRRLDDLAAADPDDPRVAGLAADLAVHIPDAMAAAMIEHSRDAAGASPVGGSMAGTSTAGGALAGDSMAGTSTAGGSPAGGSPVADGERWLGTFAGEMAPAQAEVLRLLMERLRERASC
ncbi:MerR family transcriptional regulator [Nonomuraea roseoviolacea]|uniref:DNA-binding transcriptional MerR regulator n=1 Tax=Nonomuraea roseoviolacea subsp. carminata TaxID=160689 RepID=A0ABT1JSA5_9ACTN|nr:MerR family transcriptional regulator [Nonomuraea roseoviolacea]MCP2344307.1 DNA-binding transcriptional MerR regulator [Nonomuraea roseoviolacea subsp. carminata]